MTLSVLIIIITAIALFITMLNGFVINKNRNWIISFLQAFSGVLFIISGFVKAVDPLGTTYKMEDYFHAFSKHLLDTPFKFLDNFWYFLADEAVYFALFMILLELLVGFFLLIGSQRRFNAWVFFIMVFFFAILTGFTYLTGYVPAEATFFEFGKWGSWVEGQMEVSDCGCFGDFLKLDPFTSFVKDVFLFIPALVFLFFHKREYQWWNASIRSIASIVFITLMAGFAFYNTWVNIPIFDFRPFKEGVDVKTTKAIEEEAMSNIQVLGYHLTNSLSGEKVELTMDEYLKDYKSYPKAEWEFEQIKTEPTMESTKISEFVVNGIDNEDLSEAMLNDESYNLWVISPIIEPTSSSVEELTVADTSYRIDSTLIRNIWVKDTIEDIQKRNIEIEVFQWPADLVSKYNEKVLPAATEMHDLGLNTYVAIGGSSSTAAADFGKNWPDWMHLGTADAILLKTIIRSNPGFLLVKNGVIIRKWHFNSFSTDELHQIIKKTD